MAQVVAIDGFRLRRSRAVVDVLHIARHVIGQIRCDKEDFNPRTTSVMTRIKEELLHDQELRDERDMSEVEIAARIETHFDFRPDAIVRQFNLRQLPTLVKGGFYRRLATYGHVGHMDMNLPWELTDKITLLT